MKHIITLFSCSILFLASCNNTSSVEGNSSDGDSTNNSSNAQATDFDVIHKDYEEFYEGGALKIEGDFDDNQKRNGLWISYYEDGTKWSESFYVHGLKEGHSVTFYPNGNVRYVGEYKDDIQTGNWRFFDESGELASEENY